MKTESAARRTVQVGMDRGLTFLMALACGAVAANIYYAQPLVALIGPDVGLSASASSLVVTLTQIGYGVGLVFLVPLGDIFENRRLITVTLVACTAALLSASVASNAALFLGTSLVIGLSSVVVQMLVPFAAHLAPEESRGQVVGNVMSGLLLGILLARPVASMTTDLLGWRAIFAISAGLMLVLALTLRSVLPERKPTTSVRYPALLASMGKLLVSTPILRRRAFYHAMLFGAFSLFWTAVPLILASPACGLSQGGIALFSLAAVLGAFVAPVAGRIADRGLTKPATGLAILAVVLCFLLVFTSGGHMVAALFVAALLLDVGISCNLVLGQRAIFSLGAEIRSRLNGLYMAIFFVGGAVGSAVAGSVYESYGWQGIAWCGIAFPLVAGLYYLTELVPRRTVPAV
ncbi:MFS transporter [Kitasatospora sp. NA04385]|uniref:MFS transporter n=1 Tax=Kitasatospora sp. NA04385 TaxID=2742135 RepID=UPI0015903249|nr:MFS transporter [Kitasatospora sp. NA04385]QKW21382.1 MFS transporter [Kitasatospora sp. NA04385]